MITDDLSKMYEYPKTDLQKVVQYQGGLKKNSLLRKHVPYQGGGSTFIRQNLNNTQHTLKSLFYKKQFFCIVTHSLSTGSKEISIKRRNKSQFFCGLRGGVRPFFDFFTPSQRHTVRKPDKQKPKQTDRANYMLASLRKLGKSVWFALIPCFMLCLASPSSDQVSKHFQ